MKRIRLVHGSTLDVLKSEKDLLITDPPFSAFVHDNLRGNLTDQTKIVTREAGYDPLTQADRKKLADHWLQHIRKWIVWFSDWESVGSWREEIEKAGGRWGRAVPWVRWSKPVGRYSIPSGSEAVCFARRGGSKAVFHGRGRTHYNVKCLRAQSHESTGYNGQKPVELMGQIILDVLPDDQKITLVDDHCGTGSTLLAAAQVPRNIRALGIDLSIEALKIARERIHKAKSQRTDK